jgi:HEAT repeat protein
MGLGRDESEPELSAQQLAEALTDGIESVRMNAARELGRLGPRSLHSVTYLTSALEVEKDGVVQGRLIDSLRGLGPKGAPAIPVLMQFLDRTNEVSMFALVALASIDPENAEYRRRLIDCLDQPGGWWAAMELGRHGGKAQEAIPHLQRLEQSSERWSARAIAAIAAWRIDPSQPNPLPRLADELLLETRMPYEVLQYLGELGPAARPAVPALRQLKASRGSIHYERLNDALGKIAPEYLQDPWRPN